MTFFVHQNLWHDARGDLLREALDDAVFPTPGPPDEHGMFLVRRQRIWITRRISVRRPTTGSSSPLCASSVRSRPNAFSAGVLTSFLSSGPPPPGETAPPPLRRPRPRIAGRAHGGFPGALRSMSTSSDFRTRAATPRLPGAGQGECARCRRSCVQRLRLLARQRQDLLHPRVTECSGGRVSVPVPTCFSTAARTVSRSSPIFWRTLTATPGQA